MTDTKEVEVPVRLLFRVPEFVDEADVHRAVENTFEHGTVRESMFAAIDQVESAAEMDGWERPEDDGNDEPFGYEGYGMGDRPLEQTLAEIHQALPAAIGHAMCFTIEDGSDDPVLLDLDMRAAADKFYLHAQELAALRPNLPGAGHGFVDHPCGRCGDEGMGAFSDPDVRGGVMLCETCYLAERDGFGGVRFTARFTPEVWQGDLAIPVDPLGDDSWDCTVEFSLMPAFRQGEMLEAVDSGGQALDGDDWLKGDPDAPEWVREWSGPFDIYVTEKETP